MKKKLFIYSTEHADLVWRRCFERDLQFKGRNFVSYADLEGYYIQDNIALCKKYGEYKFTVESVAMLKKFLERNPEYEEDVKVLIENGQLQMPFSGNNIVDSNMSSGEGIIRNYLYGREWLKNKYNYIPYGIDRSDAFGNSAQLPQIARKFGVKWIFNIAYSVPDNLYWRGLDGSRVLVWEPKQIGSSGGYYKYPPCPACGGHRDTDCDVCKNRRIDVEFLEKMRVQMPDTLPDFDDTIPPKIYCGGEEIIPSEKVIEWARKNADKYDIEFANFDDYLPYISDMLEKTDTVGEDMLHSSSEINVNNTGCYVTRIKTKQTVRENENAITALETLAVADAVKNGGYNYEEIEAIWEKYFFTIFHDSIPATHVDAAYDEIMDAAAEIKDRTQKLTCELLAKATVKKDDVVTVYNPYGSEVSKEVFVTLDTKKDICVTDSDGKEIPLCSCEKNNGTVTVSFWANGLKPFSKTVFGIKESNKTFVKTEKVLYQRTALNGNPILTDVASDVEIESNISQNEEIVIENEFYTVKAVQNGISEIFDKRLNKVISKQSEYMPGEWILEHDEGSPWTTLSNDMRRQPLGKTTHLEKVVKTDGEERLDFVINAGELDAYAVMSFVVSYSVVLKKGSDTVHFVSDVTWDTQNYRFRIAMPCIGSAKGFYEIPYGVIEREPYEVNNVRSDNTSKWAGASGDYPAINWAGAQCDDYSLALFNKGTPSYQIKDDKNGNATIYLSVLRSPSVGTYLHSPVEYTMTDYDGMRDAGKHHFDYGIKAYRDGFDKNSAVEDGVSFNARLCTLNGCATITDLPYLICDDARISSVKYAQDKKGIILRINEYHGKNSEGTLVLPECIQTDAIYECDLKEDKPENGGNVEINGKTAKINIKPFEIKTIYIAL